MPVSLLCTNGGQKREASFPLTNGYMKRKKKWSEHIVFQINGFVRLHGQESIVYAAMSLDQATLKTECFGSVPHGATFDSHPHLTLASRSSPGHSKGLRAGILG